MANKVLPAWHPQADIETLHARAHLLHSIRAFFAARSVLEVETPVLSAHGTTDPYIESFCAAKPRSAHNSQAEFTHAGYLQTSPEFPMKRLLCAGSGCIYQICKVFRQEQSGRRHNPEFTLLEWYRVGFDHHDLMQEVDAFLQHTLACKPAQTISYQALFEQIMQIDPLSITHEQLVNHVDTLGILAGTADEFSHDDLLNLLFSHVIEPNLGHDRPLLVHSFPASQSALARINADDPRTADRFEAYVAGMELANGFYELADAPEQRQRFESDNRVRARAGQPEIPQDEHLLDALAHGLPDCAGVALGLDRLLMLKMQRADIQDVLAFPFQRA
ncbi:elongation factor P--(R)-beta-lysine ligase [Alteromonas oceanisediminis]|uniref:elongation factor P--(R)-beta-lysine ligase n=1 Tax=Alteromonas oceanisediminis TaxID=2836180 RepID=UPI001BD9E778|nr:elongation factor P--(R)-beta-lysine ligase [Alteromonas oceanisediminis]MBT0585344.1 elongation factor P--(R)-beta-lysine ligase [Alteromonas oceanisediminis]